MDMKQMIRIDKKETPVDSKHNATYDIGGAHTTWLVNLQSSFHVRKQSQVRTASSKSTQPHESQQSNAILPH